MALRWNYSVYYLCCTGGSSGRQRVRATFVSCNATCASVGSVLIVLGGVPFSDGGRRQKRPRY